MTDQFRGILATPTALAGRFARIAVPHGQSTAGWNGIRHQDRSTTVIGMLYQTSVGGSIFVPASLDQADVFIAWEGASREQAEALRMLRHFLDRSKMETNLDFYALAREIRHTRYIPIGPDRSRTLRAGPDCYYYSVEVDQSRHGARLATRHAPWGELGLAVTSFSAATLVVNPILAQLVLMGRAANPPLMIDD